MTADDAALYAERDEANQRADALEERLAAAESNILQLRKHNGWLYRKWHVAASNLARLEKSNR